MLPVRLAVKEKGQLCRWTCSNLQILFALKSTIVLCVCRTLFHHVQSVHSIISCQLSDFIVGTALNCAAFGKRKSLLCSLMIRAFVH